MCRFKMTHLMKSRTIRIAAAALAFAVPLEAREIEIRGRLAGAAGAEIVLTPMAGAAAAGPEKAAARVRAEEDGSFRLFAPGPGMWRLTVAAPGSVPVVNHLRPLLSRRDVGEVAVPEARRQSVRVVDAEGTGVAGLRLVAGGTVPMAPEMRDAGWSLGDRTAVTDDEGRTFFPRAEEERFYVAGAGDGYFAYAELASGETVPAEIVLRPLTAARVVDAHGRPAPGVRGYFERPREPFDRSGDEGELLLPAAAELAFTDAEGPLDHELRSTEDALVVQLRSAPTVDGRIVDARTGDAVDGALVWTEGAHAEADRHGAFALRLGGDGEVRAAASGYLPAAWGERRPGSGPWDPFAGELTIALRPAATLAGTVADPDGAGISGVEVRAYPDRRHEPPVFMQPWIDQGPPTVDAVTGPEGRFELRRLSPDDAYRLVARLEGFGPDVVEVVPGPEAEPVRMVLQPGLQAFGRVLDVDRRPIAGARVELVVPRLHGFRSREETGEGGRFAFRDLPSGSHRLRAWAEGFEPSEVREVEISREAESDLGTVVLEPALVLRGRVIDVEGRPLAGAKIFVGAPYPGGEAVAGTDGAFEVGHLPRGRTLRLSASHEGYQRISVEVVPTENAEPVELVMSRGGTLRGRVVDAAGRPASGAAVSVEGRTASGRFSRGLEADVEGQFTYSGAPGPVTVRAGSPEGWTEPVEVTLETRRTKEVELVLRPGATLEGRVLDADEIGVADVSVSLERTTAGGGKPKGFRFGRSSAVSDGAGRFALKGLAPGIYLLRAYHPDFEVATEEVELEPQDVRRERIRLGPRIERPSIRGRVMDPNGRGVGGAGIRIWKPDAWMTTEPSSPDGSFRVRVPGPGTYELTAIHGAHGQSPATEVEVAAVDVDGVVLELAAGARVHGRIIGLGPRDLGRLNIRANDAEGGFGLGQVGADGSYDIRGLTAGQWTVEATLGRSRQVRETVTLSGAGDVALLDLEFPKGYRLRGVVLLEGQALAGAQVSLSCADGSPLTGLDGRFAFDYVAPGPCEIRVGVPGSPALGVRRELEIAEDEDVALEIESASLDGTVVDAVTGAPLTGVEIDLLRDADEHGRGVDSTRTDAIGRFAFPRLAAGRWRIRATAEGYGVAVKAVDAAGTESAGEIRLRPTAPLVLEVRTPSGEVPPHVSLELLRVDEEHPEEPLLPRQSYRPGREGRLVLQSLPPGRYRLRLSGPWSRTEIEVDHPGPDVVRIVLGGG